MADYNEDLSERELDVLRCIARGASNKEAAAELHISENTVKVHLRRVFAKLGVSSRTEATRVAIQLGLVIVPGVEIETPVEEPPPIADEGSSATAVPITEKIATPTNAPAAPPVTPVQAPLPRKFPIWRTISLVLAVLLVIAVVSFISLRLRAEDTIVAPEPFIETPMGEDWSLTNRPLPIALADMAVTAVGLSVYAIGGETDDAITNNIYNFNVSEHAWHQLTPKPTAVAAASAAGLFGEIYVVGGRLADGQLTNIVEVYSPTQNAWRPVTALPQPISSGVALSDGSFLYLFGGWNGSEYLDTTYVYDPGEDSWRPLPAMTHNRAFATGQFMFGQLYVVGGFDGEKELNTCEFFDPNLLQWFDCPPLLLPRGGSASAAVLNKLYVIGGGFSDAQEVIYSERYDPTTETWQVINTPLLNETPTWTGLGVANVENRIFVFGGRHSGTLSADTYIYSPFVYRTFLPSVPLEGSQ
jgi:DNA-binding CsgD family transcriptional regulator/N-acetylneuraminic acid mutarotase